MEAEVYRVSIFETTTTIVVVSTIDTLSLRLILVPLHYKTSTTTTTITTTITTSFTSISTLIVMSPVIIIHR